MTSTTTQTTGGKNNGLCNILPKHPTLGDSILLMKEEKTMKRIEIFPDLEQNVWMTLFFNPDTQNPDPDIVALFGTHIIPTAYTLDTTEWEVVNAIESLNPNYTIGLVNPPWLYQD